VAILTAGEREQFQRDGYVLVGSVVAEDLLARADEEIDRFIHAEQPTDVLEVHGPAVLRDHAEPGQHQWFPPVDRLPACDAALRSSDALRAANELVAPGELVHAFDHIQVATTVAPWSHVPDGPHLDGHTEHPPNSFTMLVGILLTDQSDSQSGNLWVWPGSHLQHSRMFSDRGARVLLESQGHPKLIAPPIELGHPTEIRGRRGDVLLAHYLLGHNKGGNASSKTRRTIYYRLATHDHRKHWEDALSDPWHEYPALRPIG
jgi:ectoine hydroxylase-related dioxygenase (phytanoyl-CoA dioxygenase family)